MSVEPQLHVQLVAKGPSAYSLTVRQRPMETGRLWRTLARGATPKRCCLTGGRCTETGHPLLLSADEDLADAGGPPCCDSGAWGSELCFSALVARPDGAWPAGARRYLEGIAFCDAHS